LKAEVGLYLIYPRNLPFEIKNVVGNEKKKLKLLRKKFSTLIHFTQWRSTLANRKLSTVSPDLYCNGTLI